MVEVSCEISSDLVGLMKEESVLWCLFKRVRILVNEWIMLFTRCWANNVGLLLFINGIICPSWFAYSRPLTSSSIAAFLWSTSIIFNHYYILYPSFPFIDRYIATSIIIIPFPPIFLVNIHTYIHACMCV